MQCNKALWYRAVWLLRFSGKKLLVSGGFYEVKLLTSLHLSVSCVVLKKHVVLILLTRLSRSGGNKLRWSDFFNLFLFNNDFFETKSSPPSAAAAVSSLAQSHYWHYHRYHQHLNRCHHQHNFRKRKKKNHHNLTHHQTPCYNSAKVFYGWLGWKVACNREKTTRSGPVNDLPVYCTVGQL